MNNTMTSPRALARLAIGALVAVLIFTGSYLVSSRRADSRSSQTDRGSKTQGTVDPLAWPASGASTAMHQNAKLSPAASARIQELEDGVKASPSSGSAHAKLARAYLSAEQFTDAFRQAEALLTLEPDHSEGLYTLSAVRMRMGQTQAALRSLEHLLQTEPTHVEGLMAYGLVQLRLGASSNAIVAWEKGLVAANGQHPELQRLLAVSRSARAERSGSTEKAPSPWQATEAPATSEPAKTAAIHPDWLSPTVAKSDLKNPPSR